jgi:hypothetical protein
MKQSPVRFFFSHAGYSYDPKTETPTQGRWKCARRLAAAERTACANGYSFDWSQDDITNRDFTDEGPEYYLWQCVCRDMSGAVVASLGGVDFGPDGEPWSSDCRRVVEAELAAEAAT